MTNTEARLQAHREWSARFHAWADAQGIKTSPRGRIPQSVRDAYIEMTDDDIDDILARLPSPPPPPAYVWLTETPHWQAWYRAQTHALTWIKGVDPAEVFALYPGAEHLGEHRLPDVVEGVNGRNLAGGTRIDDWTLVYLPGEWRSASLEDAPRISRELCTTVITFWQIGSHRDRFGYARDGDLMVEFDPMFPDDRYGTEPDLLTGQMSEAGLLPVAEGDHADHSVLRALELARLLTGVHIDPEVLDGRFQWVLIPANDRAGH